MTLSFKRIARTLSKQSRRALIALAITGALTASATFDSIALSDELQRSNPAVANPNADSNVGVPQNTNALDYWIFSSDYCGWASEESSSALFSFNPLAKESVAAKQAVPVIVNQPTNAAETVTPANANLVGSAPFIMSLAEGYIPYDMSRADQIALRMYPITIPQFDSIVHDYDHLQRVSDRHSFGDQMDVRKPLDCLGYGVLWNQEISPSQSVSTKQQTKSATVPDKKLAKQLNWTLPGEFKLIDAKLRSEMAAAETEANEKRRGLALAIIEAVNPQSDLRQSISPAQCGNAAGTAFSTAYAATEIGFRTATRSVAASVNAKPKSRTQQLEMSVGEKLLVRAGVEASELNCATAGVADDVVRSVCCPVERFENELAAQLPDSYKVAETGVAAATLSLPQEPQAIRSNVARAEALATACDLAAATLERWALAFRRAGDSAVRVARQGSSVQGGADLR